MSLINPLYQRIQKIALSHAKDRRISHAAFNGIRNRSSVRAVLDDLGYVPNNPTNPSYWILKTDLKIDIEKAKAENVRAPKKIEVPQKLSHYQLVLAAITKKGIYHSSDFKGSRVYLSCLICRIKKLGYEIKPNKQKNVVVSYELIDG